MASELRWILLALSAVLLIGIWWWGVRRSRQSPGNAQLRETSTAPTIMGPTIMGPTVMGPTVPGQAPSGYTPEPDAHDAGSRDWGVPPFEPLNIRTADFDQGPALDLPMSATAEPLDVTLDMDFVDHGIAATPEVADDGFAERRLTDPPEYPSAADPGARATVAPAEVPRAQATAVPTMARATPAATAPSAPAAASTPNTSETQRIVTVRVCAVGDANWPGADLLAALERHDLRFGRYKVFHRHYGDGRTLFCVASLVEPGTFDLARMPHEEFRGLSLFAVLPGPADALETIDALIATAADLADTLSGAVQDANGAPLSAQRAEALREDVARFQLSLYSS